MNSSYLLKIKVARKVLEEDDIEKGMSLLKEKRGIHNTGK